MDLEIKESGNALSFAVKAVPRASRNALAEIREGVLVARLCAPPVEGKANAALIAFMAEVLQVRKNQVSIKMGEKSRHKFITVSGLSTEQVRQRISTSLKG